MTTDSLNQPEPSLSLAEPLPHPSTAVHGLAQGIGHQMGTRFPARHGHPYPRGTHPLSTP